MKTKDVLAVATQLGQPEPVFKKSGWWMFGKAGGKRLYVGIRQKKSPQLLTAMFRPNEPEFHPPDPYNGRIMGVADLGTVSEERARDLVLAAFSGMTGAPSLEFVSESAARTEPVLDSAQGDLEDADDADEEMTWHWLDEAAWIEPAWASPVRQYYLSLSKPIFSATDQSPPHDVRMQQAAAFLMNVLVWGVSTLTNSSKLSTRYVSEGTLPLLAQMRQFKLERRLVKDGKAILKELRHEHVFERRELVQQLLKDRGEPQALDRVLACLVTKAEHKRLGKVTGSGWERYAAAGVGVWDRSGAGAWFKGPFTAETKPA